MATISTSAAVLRSDAEVTKDPFALTPSLVCAQDDIRTIVLQGGTSATIPLGSIAHVSAIYMTSSMQISVALTLPGPVVLTGFKADTFVLSNTDVIGIALTNSDPSNPATVRLLLGGA